jgi:twitching motility protein PilT
VAKLLRFAVESHASDLHISSGEAPMVRIDGDMRRIDYPALTRDETHRMIFDLMNDSQRRAFQEHLEVDFSFALDDVLRFRVNVFIQNRGEAAVFRSIPCQIPGMDELGLPPVVHTFCKADRGLVLVTGPTGSGKSTTLAAMIDHINSTEEGHILTLEDPIEFVHTPRKCMVNQREIGPMSHSFSAALRSALREDPDVILVGEMRDLETIALALTAAETGHLVFGTLHTASAPKTIDRVIDAFPQNQQAQVRAMLAESLVGVVAQKLLKKLGGGRVAALEIMVGTPAVRNLIRENKSFQLTSVIQAGGRFGMQAMDAAIVALEQRQLISSAEACAHLGSPESAALGAPAAAGGAR